MRGTAETGDAPGACARECAMSESKRGWPAVEREGYGVGGPRGLTSAAEGANGWLIEETERGRMRSRKRTRTQHREFILLF